MFWIVVSDNHTVVEPIITLPRMYPQASGFIHCGDSEQDVSELKGYHAVLGNNDYYASFPEHLVVPMGAHRALVVHGHRTGVYNRMAALAKQAKQYQCDLVFFGHTHVFSDEIVDGVRIMNPGSVWRSRDGRGKTYGVFEIKDDGSLAFACKIYDSRNRSI